jgi:hypothetical protein
MEQTFTVIASDGSEREITETEHPEWDQLGDPCPECGKTEYRHFTSEGGRYGLRQEAVILRSDYWQSKRTLLTQCLSCRTVLQKHPAFDLLYD